MKNILISLCMIVKNEEVCLERCLKNVHKFADEIIIVDTGSTDKTKEIAKVFTDKVYDYVWENNFAKARNFSFQKASGKYIIWLDADDFISPDNLKKLMDLKKNMNGGTDVYMLKYESAFDSQGNSTFTFYRERILKNSPSLFWQGAVHEVITPHGKIEYTDIAIKHLRPERHNSKRNLKIYQSLLKKGNTFSPREQYYYSRELYYHKQYRKAVTQLNKFLKMENSWLEDKLGALEIKALCQLNLNEPEKALQTLFQSFSFSPPRANFLCLIGDVYLNENKFNQCLFWYQNALSSEKNYQNQGFVNDDYYGIYPALQLCLAFYKLGDIASSKKYNDLALSINPQNESALKNKEFFESL